MSEKEVGSMALLITYMDSETFETAVYEQEFSDSIEIETILFMYSDGNWSCDCNRAIEFDSTKETHLYDELETKFGKNCCFGANRFIVVDVNNYDGDKDDFIEEVNSCYDQKLFQKCIEKYSN